mmetsp:Transcript_33845/g.46320  ORF Transcript_33845/g.46320 Transcript_33845/m.46320 type:complete len:223 (+) Transcript_33845:561-1229(+)
MPQSMGTFRRIVIICFTVHYHKMDHSIVKGVPHVPNPTRIISGHQKSVAVSSEVIKVIGTTNRSSCDARSFMVPRTGHVRERRCDRFHCNLPLIPSKFIGPRVLEILIIGIRDITNVKKPINILQLFQSNKCHLAHLDSHITQNSNSERVSISCFFCGHEAVFYACSFAPSNHVIITSVRSQTTDNRMILSALIITRGIGNDFGVRTTTHLAPKDIVICCCI